MASAFSHIAIPISIRMAVGRNAVPWRLLVFAAFMSVAPDLDAIAFRMGIPYESQWGHRGFTHSIFFALVCSLFSGSLFQYFRTSRLNVFLVSFVSMLSHGLLDACTTGGLGVAFLWPFQTERYFFPWQIIEVSPVSVGRFFTHKGISVLLSELTYIWLPSLAMAILGYFLRRFLDRSESSLK